MNITGQFIILGVVIVLIVVVRSIHDQFRTFSSTPSWKRPIIFLASISGCCAGVYGNHFGIKLGEEVDQGLYAGYELFIMMLSGMLMIFSFLIFFSSILSFIMSIFANSEEVDF